MSFNKKMEDRLEVALADRPLKEQLLDELQEMRDLFNAVLTKLDADSGVSDTDFSALLAIKTIRDKNKKTKL